MLNSRIQFSDKMQVNKKTERSHRDKILKSGKQWPIGSNLTLFLDSSQAKKNSDDIEDRISTFESARFPITGMILKTVVSILVISMSGLFFDVWRQVTADRKIINIAKLTDMLGNMGANLTTTTHVMAEQLARD